MVPLKSIIKSDSFEKVFYEEKERLFQYASYRMADIADAEDAVHDLFLALTAKKPMLGNVDNMRAYMFRSLINLCNERVRSKNPTVSMTDFPELDILELSPANFDEEFQIINRLLEHLPPEQNETIRLRLYAGLTFDEIAQTTQVNISTAKARFRYGIEKLRDGLKKQNLL